MRPRSLAALLPSVLLLGCPHDSATPLADFSDVSLDDRLVGSWRCVSSDGEEPAMLSFSRVGPAELQATLSDDDEDASRFRLRSAKAGSTQLVNVEALQKTDKAFWSLARLTLHRAGILQVELAREEPFKEASTAGPREVIDRSLERGDLFEDLCVCTRVKEEQP